MIYWCFKIDISDQSKTNIISTDVGFLKNVLVFIHILFARLSLHLHKLLHLCTTERRLSTKIKQLYKAFFYLKIGHFVS